MIRNAYTLGMSLPRPSPVARHGERFRGNTFKKVLTTGEIQFLHFIKILNLSNLKSYRVRSFILNTADFPHNEN